MITGETIHYKPVIVLLTDFGPDSPYVGQMKLIFQSHAPTVSVIDLAHDVAPQDILSGFLILRGAKRFLPPHSVVCAIVDPGVGSSRRILTARFERGITALLPDNGLIHGFCANEEPTEVRWVRNENLFIFPISSVFHGRDIFAPVAAFMAMGGDWSQLGDAISLDSCVQLRMPPSRHTESEITGEIIHTDHFGNLITNIHRAELGSFGKGSVFLGNLEIVIRDHYCEATLGSPVALIGSYDFLELSVRNGSAAKKWGAHKGDKVIFRPYLASP